MLMKSAITSTYYSTRSRNFFLHLLKKSTTVAHLTQTHAQIILNGFQNDLSTITKLTHRLFDLKAVSYARHLFHSIPNPDLFLFNVLIKGLSNAHSISIYTHMRKCTHLKPNNFTYAFAIASASTLSDEKVGILLHEHAVVDGYSLDLFVGTAVVDFYLKIWRVDMARKVFDKMSVRDTVSWNSMISGLVRNCCFDDAVQVFGDMLKDSGIRLDSTTLAAVLPALAELQDLILGMEVQCLALKLGFHSYVHLLTGLISLYSKCGEIEVAKLLFGEIGRPDLVSYNAMISGYTSNGGSECSLRLFKQLLGSGEKVNSSTIVGLIPVFHPFGYFNLTTCIHSFCVKSGIISQSSVSTALTTVYSRLNEIKSARLLFDESSEKTSASWNAMISGYTQNGSTEAAISLFQEMQRSKVSPNPVTFTSTLSACAQLGALSLGKWVHGLVKSKNFETNIYVSTALIDMYAKCGGITEARELFDLMVGKNVVTWNAMISGYGLHGQGQDALRLFSEMSHSGVAPNGVTFLSLLYACSHAGLVKEGEEIFQSMIHDYHFEPLPEHYACMVDILGRAGQLEKALKFIKEMPVEPGAAEWGALLGACVIHKDKKLAQVASERLFELDPENVGYYVLLSNLYSAERNYRLAASVRQDVKKRKLAKIPGCTLIEIGETPHVFTSGDKSHPQASAIYAVLEKLIRKMKEAGFQTETDAALHDVEEEEKELVINVHSEKLAIAFGLIATAPGTEIRIFKNLRVCVDCHSATKFISKITERVIVVRDANRFHHFKDGLCSCGDYW
ncbi:Pentatricopeptide repeat-containing protein [Hibiscus syriacus]|uniref:Pentatricopeptide repeat-containing protein n=1 Tax=Hibiscus syriacus TaxID=106335 RepID=A0A6A3A8Q4_HIBSY|nr:pentatricopeptide repeat-containing protein At4g30700 [Hibiscus syriacus]KAE8700157.1 Pentatricopeptide repeat-containing protein [Hibiscus syriacus]